MHDSPYPFILPFNKNTPGKKLASGVATNVPLCFQEFAEITYHSCMKFTENNLREMISAVQEKAEVPQGTFYSAISHIKLPVSSKVLSFQNMNRSLILKPGKLLLNPSINTENACLPSWSFTL